MKLTTDNKAAKIVCWSIGAFVFISLLILFAIFDQQISQTIFDNGINESTKTFTTILGGIGLVLPALPVFFSFSALAQKLLNNNRLMFKGLIYWTLITLITVLVILHTNLGFFLGTQENIEKEIMIMFSIFYLAVIITYQAWFWTKKRKDYLFIERQFYLGMRAVTYLTIINLMVTVMKFSFGRPRPFQVLEDGFNYYYPFEINFSDERGVSFPSGHTISAMSLFALSILFLSNTKNTKKVTINTIFGIIVFLVAASRVLWIKHWTTDVFTSMGIGLLFYNVMQMTYVKKVEQLEYMRCVY